MGTTCNAGHNGERVAIGNRSGFAADVADVLVVEVDIDEAAQLALVVVKVLAQVGKTGGETLQHFAGGCARQIHGGGLFREMPQGGRDADSGHVSSSFSA